MLKKIVHDPGALAVLFALCLSCNCQATSQIKATGVDDENQIRTLSTSPDIDSTWRHTKYGWQDSVGWPSADPYLPIKTVELLHPLVWAGIVLITVMATMIWASSEWEIARLFEDDEPGEFQPSASNADRE